jgi:hypothetical protein
MANKAQEKADIYHRVHQQLCLVLVAGREETLKLQFDKEENMERAAISPDPATQPRLQ